MLAFLGVDPQSLPITVQVEAGHAKRGVDPVGVEEVANPEHQYVRPERMQARGGRLNTNDRERLASSDPDARQFVSAEIGVLPEAVPGDPDSVAAEVRIHRRTSLGSSLLERVEIVEQPPGDNAVARQVQSINAEEKLNGSAPRR